MSKLYSVNHGVEQEVVHCCSECKSALLISIKTDNARVYTCVTCNDPNSNHYRHLVLDAHPACSSYIGDIVPKTS